ncbi:hypothetical protein B0H10DRAFT_1944702 [Mycena sp. CBHHK59/15]|nr:hypothetical protein B0H10DRAFT_1944702 [Mycena sp. CBHHK59/15]
MVTTMILGLDSSSSRSSSMQIWVLCLEGKAKAWWEDVMVWMGKDQKDIKEVAKVFGEKWLNPKTMKKKPYQLMADFDCIMLSDADMGKRLFDERGAKTTYPLQLAKDLKKKVHAAGNCSNLMVPHAVAKIPLRLMEAIGLTCVDIQTWDDLRAKCRGGLTCEAGAGGCEGEEGAGAGGALAGSRRESASGDSVSTRQHRNTITASALHVFALYDAEGLYVGDSDTGCTYSEWEEGYTTAQQDLYSGNGGRLSAIWEPLDAY